MEKCIKSKVIYKGKLLDFMTDEVVLDDGTKSTREYVKHPGGVCILGFVDGKIILEKQFRYPYNEVILELPAGKLEANESPIDAAKREFEEETGYKVNNLISLGTMYPTLAYTNEVIHLFYADNLSKGEKHLDFDERIDLEFFNVEEIKKLIETNKIKDAKTICLFYKFLEYVSKR